MIDGIPVLTLNFKGGGEGRRVKFSLPRPTFVSQEEINRELKDVKLRHPKLPLATLTGPVREVSEREQMERFSREEFNRNLDLFYQDYESYLVALNEHKNIKRRTLRICLELRNEGARPAERVDLIINLPQGLRAFLAPPPAPSEPQPPTLKEVDIIRNLLGNAPRKPPPPPSAAPTKRDQMVTIADDGGEIHFRLRRLKHQLKTHVFEFLAAFDSYEDAASFTLTYRIVADNTPAAATGRLDVVVEKKATPAQ